MFELSRDQVLRTWGACRPGPMPSIAGVRFERCSPIRAAIAAGTYDADGTREAVAVARLADAIFKPDLAEAERAAFDKFNDGEKWDGLG